MIRKIATTTLMALAMACAKDTMGPRTPVSGLQQPQALSPSQERQTSPAEEALISRIVALNPAGASVLNRLLRDRRVASIKLDDARARPLLAQLDSLRALQVVEAKAKAKKSDVSATLVLTDRLSDSTADVEVVRRASHGHSADYIVLPRGKASPAALGNGIAALYSLRKKFGDVPTADMRIIVHGAKMPRSWPPELVEQAAQMVGDLYSGKRIAIPGVGAGPSARVPLVATSTTP